MLESTEKLTPEEIVGSKVSLRRNFLSLKTLVSFLLAFLVLYLLFSKIEFHKVINVLSETNLGLFSVSFAVFYFSVYLRGVRWHLLLKNLGFHEARLAIVEILFISWFVNVIVPAKLGDLYRSYLLHRNYRYSTSKALGSVLTERIFDMVVLFILFVIAALFSFRVEFPGVVRYLFLCTIIVTLLMLTVLFMMKYCGSLVRRFLPERLADIYGRVEAGTLGSIKNVPLMASITLIIWILEAGRLYFVSNALGTSLPFMLIVFIALASSLLTSLPITPAGLGAVEFAIVGILLLFHVDINRAVSIAILDRIVGYWSVILFGFLTFISSKKC